MKPAEQLELEQLIELLLEERISTEEVARLNQLLKIQAAQEHYVNYLMLHGMLSWDAGLNCPFSKQAPDLLSKICHNDSNPGITNKLKLTPPKSKNLSLTLIAACIAFILGFSSYYSGLFSISHPVTVAEQQESNPTTTQAIINQESDKTLNIKDKFPVIQLVPREVTDKQDLQTVPELVANNANNKAENHKPVYATNDFSNQAMISLINEHLARSWEDTGVSPSPVAEDSEWLRRVYLDLAGRIPNAQERMRFIKNDHVHKREEIVNALLQSADFSRQFANRWSTLLVGRSREKHPERAALRDFLTHSIDSEHTWSRIFQDLITAEGSLEENGATGFLLAHLNDMAVPATAVTCRLLLGEQLQCVQCHKHPNNEWTQDYFWEINSFFKQTKAVTYNENNQNILKLVNENVGGPTYYETFNGLMKVAYPKLGMVKVDAGQGTNRRSEFSRLLLSQKDQQISRAFVNRCWAMLFGYGFTNPIDDLGPHNPASHPELFNQLSRGFVANDYNIRKLITWICLSDAYQLTTKLGNENSLDQPEKGETPLFSRVYLKMMSPEQLYISLQVLESGHSRTLPELIGQEAWTEQFVIFAQNDENNEFDQSSGTINQALELMNGDLMDEVVHKSCQQLLIKSRLKGKWNEAQTLQLINELSQTFMTRDASPREVVVFKKLLEQNLTHGSNSSGSREQALLQTLEDMAWAFLNSSEFVLIH